MIWYTCILQNYPHNKFYVQLLGRVWLFATPWTAARQASLSITHSQSLLKLMSIESVMPSNPLILCRLFSSRLHSSQHQGLFKWVHSSHQVAKVLEFGRASASVLPMTIQGWFPLGLTGLISCHKKEWEWVTCRDVDGPRVCCPEWSKFEREKEIH